MGHSNYKTLSNWQTLVMGATKYCHRKQNRHFSLLWFSLRYGNGIYDWKFG